jgi:hypothetical protein
MKSRMRSKKRPKKRGWLYLADITLSADITYCDMVDNCCSHLEALDYFLTNSVLLAVKSFTLSVRSKCNDVTCPMRGWVGTLECEVHKSDLNVSGSRDRARNN